MILNIQKKIQKTFFDQAVQTILIKTTQENCFLLGKHSTITIVHMNNTYQVSFVEGLIHYNMNHCSCMPSLLLKRLQKVICF